MLIAVFSGNSPGFQQVSDQLAYGLCTSNQAKLSYSVTAMVYPMSIIFRNVTV